MQLLRFIKILMVALRFGLDEFLITPARTPWLAALLRRLLFWRDLAQPRGVRLRLALESLGPIFVKFGQVMSTRQDLLPRDIALELALLQDRVKPFPVEQVFAIIERVYGRPADAVFASFDPVPEASASVAQVHFAILHEGPDVAVKVLRPEIQRTIHQDVSLLSWFARLVESLWADARRLKPREVVAEFARYLSDELDLMREAGNASQLRRNFLDSDLLEVPEVYWDYCHSEVMVMQRMRGTPISRIEQLQAQGISLPRLAKAGVEIFFTQVFRDGFFHADMHPGNILVNERGQYIALDFGIMGTLTDVDRNYLAMNFLAFFKRDYKRVAVAHIEAGWAPRHTRVEELESAIRSVCEPVFDRPLKDISFGKVLLRLFQTSRRFGIEIQPQLVLLQKTMLNIEGLGRTLDPDLDLWDTAKPYLERWMNEQIGWRGLLRNLKEEAPYWSSTLPQLPRLLHDYLAVSNANEQLELLQKQQARAERQNRQLKILLLVAIVLIAWLVVTY